MMAGRWIEYYFLIIMLIIIYVGAHDGRVVSDTDSRHSLSNGMAVRIHPEVGFNQVLAIAQWQE